MTRLETVSEPHHRRKEETHLEACLNLSLNALRDDDTEVWQNFVWLGVLPDDAIVAAPMVATLWGIEEAKAADRLALLCNNVLMMAIIHAHLAWHLGQTAIFAADVALAWRLAEDLFEDHPSQAIALQCRYALIVSTLNSLSTDLPPPSPGALLQKYVRVPKQGLAYALQSSNPETKAILLTEISDYLPQNLKEEALQEALAATKAIQYENDRLKALKILAPKLPPDLLPEALAIAMDVRFERDRGERASALIALASEMSKMQTGKLFPLWQKILHSLSFQSRRDFLPDILALNSVI